MQPCVAVKYGSKMIDGAGEFRVYQNFWCAYMCKAWATDEALAASQYLSGFLQVSCTEILCCELHGNQRGQCNSNQSRHVS